MSGPAVPAAGVVTVDAGVVDRLRQLADAANRLLPVWLPATGRDSLAEYILAEPAAFIAAASPDIVRQLLDDRDDLAAKVAAVREVVTKLRECHTPGGEFYVGGDEQLLAADAVIVADALAAALAVGVREDTATVGEDTKR